MRVAVLILGLVLLFGALLDAFQTIILPRRPVGQYRITRIFFLFTYIPWCWMAKRIPYRKVREQTLSIYGPMSLLLLFILWATLILAAWGLIFYGIRAPFLDAQRSSSLAGEVFSCLYVSGTTIFTLGLGDVQPASHLARVLLVVEAGTGLGFVALVIGYVPVIYQAFSSREVAVAMLDARAGSPPSAGELLTRHNFEGGHEALSNLLAEWERWAAEMLETHVSYPILCYYRSQHDNQSWLAAMTAVLDTCALLITVVEGPATRQAQLTFAIVRHALVDLGHVFNRKAKVQQCRDRGLRRLDADGYAALCAMLSSVGFKLCPDAEARVRLDGIRKLYEPEAHAMAEYLLLPLPSWTPPPLDPLKSVPLWQAVSKLRSPSAQRVTPHVSPLSTAAATLDDSQLH